MLSRKSLNILTTRPYSSTHPRKKVVAVLGGGITGLSTAYYLVKKYGDKVHPIVLEQSDRFGGWVKTVNTPGGSRYEIGPRTIRPAGLSGMNTLDLVEELGLDKQVLYVEKNHPTAKNRFVYVNGKLCRLPSDGKALVKRQEPFSKALGWALLRDLVMLRRKTSDDSIHNFVSRRFGPEIANYLIDPLIRGICAGNSRDISARFLTKQLFEYEQQYGSVLLGMAVNKFKKSKQGPCTLSEDHRTIGFSKIALASPYWAVWTLENGLESLVNRLEEFLMSHHVPLRKNITVTGIRMEKSVNELELEFHYTGNVKKRDELVCNHVISCVNGSTLATILRQSKPSHPEIWSILKTKYNVDLQVTCLTFTNPELIMHNGFGFLVPSSEKDVQGLLGVVFDTNSFPQSNNRTVLTVMSRSEDGKHQPLEKIMWYLEKTLKIKETPSEHYTELLTDCIPQYTVGYYERIEAVQKYIQASNLPLSVAGASWGGISVNDCVLSGRDAASNLETYYERFKGRTI